MNKIIDLNKLDDNELEDIINRAKDEIESRKVEGQFDVFEPHWMETYYYYDPSNDEVVALSQNHTKLDRSVDLTLIKRRTKEAAEKDGELWRRTKKIERRIAELNREYGWVCDWDDEYQKKHYFWIDYECRKVRNSIVDTYQEAPTRQYMCEEAAQQILQEFSEPVLHAFVTQEWVK